MRKFEARQAARTFVTAALRSMSMPAWPIEHGLISGDDQKAHDWFLEEVRHIANRIDNRRKAEANQRKTDLNQRRPNRRERAVRSGLVEPR